ncbi:hypothetical protein V6N11_049375 [Hibiscus sabdariffa]|uniref:Uncharacterized protein n=1 Tax=Hibiscus sabdariffa TaxID=183260 RepID=A0ABR1ZWK0_9ROSI
MGTNEQQRMVTKNGHHRGAASPTSRDKGWKLAKHANVVEGMGSGRTHEQARATGEAAGVSIRGTNGMRSGRAQRQADRVGEIA